MPRQHLGVQPLFLQLNDRQRFIYPIFIYGFTVWLALTFTKLRTAFDMSVMLVLLTQI